MRERKKTCFVEVFNELLLHAHADGKLLDSPLSGAGSKSLLQMSWLPVEICGEQQHPGSPTECKPSTHSILFPFENATLSMQDLLHAIREDGCLCNGGPV